MLLTRVVLPLMQEQGGGSIVNIASDAAKVPTPGESVIGAAMAAIVMFSKVAALEAKRNGIPDDWPDRVLSAVWPPDGRRERVS